MLDDFIPVNIKLAEQIGLVDAAVAGAIWLKWNIKKQVCNAGTRELGRTCGLNHSTVSNSIKRLVASGLVEDTSPNRRGAPHDLVPSVDLINTLCKVSVDLIDTLPKSVDLIDTSVDLINKEEVKEIKEKKIGPVTSELLNICNQDYEFVLRNNGLKQQLASTTELLKKMNATPNDLQSFETWRKANHWTGKSSPTLKQVGEFWGEYTASKNGNGSKSSPQVSKHQNLTEEEAAKLYDFNFTIGGA